MDISGLGFLPAGSAIFGGGILGGSLNAENGPAARDERGNLAPLDAADFEMVGSEDKNGSGRGLAKFGDITGIAVENRPADA